jgi:hypothetical protein
MSITRRDGGVLMVFAFIDTNVLMQFRMFDEVDWPTEVGVSAVTLVFSPVVFTELDKYKWGGTRRQKNRARTVVKKLGALNLSTTPVLVRSGVQAVALDAEPNDALFTQHRLDPQSADDRLLASYCGFLEEHRGARALILSADVGLATKGRSRRVEVVSPDDGLELPDEPDEVERELAQARRELAEIKSAAPDLRLTFGDGETHSEYDVHLVTAIDDETRGQLLAAWRKRYPYAQGTPSTLTGPAGQGLSLNELMDSFRLISRKEDTDYNVGIDRVFQRYEEFLDSWPASVNAQRRILPFNLVLENGGTAPATDVDLEFWTDARGLWIEDLPKEPSVAPGLRDARSLFDRSVRMPYLDHLGEVRLAGMSRNEDGPNILDGPPQRVQYAVKRVMHHVPCGLPAVYFQFEDDDAIGSFTLHVRLVAANIRVPRTDPLHVLVKRTGPVPPPLPPEPGDESED